MASVPLTLLKAVLAWTGSADQVVYDFVQDRTASGAAFFTAWSLTVLAQGSTSLQAGVWRTLDVPGGGRVRQT